MVGIRSRLGSLRGMVFFLFSRDGEISFSLFPFSSLFFMALSLCRLYLYYTTHYDTDGEES
jgi:hypothetical protein